MNNNTKNHHDELVWWQPVRAMMLCILATMPEKQQAKTLKNFVGLARLRAEKGDWVTANFLTDCAGVEPLCEEDYAPKPRLRLVQ